MSLPPLAVGNATATTPSADYSFGLLVVEIVVAGGIVAGVLLDFLGNGGRKGEGKKARFGNTITGFMT